MNALTVFFFLFISTVGVFAFTSCDTVPISLSSIPVCTDNTCVFDQSLNLAFSSLPGQTQCLVFNSPDPSIPSVNVTLVLRNYFFGFPMEYNYISSDLVYDIKGYCSCPLASDADCTHCPVDIKYSSALSCFTGSHDSSYCPLNLLPGVHGRYCVKASFDIKEHFQIIKFRNQPYVKAEFDVYINNDVYPFTYRGTSLDTVVTQNLSLTVTGSTAKTDFWDYVVIDNQDNYGVYLFNSDEVNNQDGYDPRKFGWLKANAAQKIPIDMSTFINSTMQDCDSNQFNFKLGVIPPHKFLQKYQMRHINTLFNDAFILGIPDLDSTKNSIGPVDPDLKYDVGVTLYNSDVPTHLGWKRQLHLNQNMMLIGQTLFGTISLWRDNALPSPATTCDTTFVEYTVTQIDCGPTITDKCFIILANKIGPATIQKLFSVMSYTEYSFFISNGTFACTQTGSLPKRTFTAMSFPDGKIHDFSISMFDSVNPSFNPSVNSTNYSFPPVLGLPAQIGDVSLNLRFKNLTVTFQQNNIDPRITALSVNGTGFTKLCSISQTTKGTCYISSDPPVFQATTIEIYPYETCIELPPFVASGSFDSSFSITCRTKTSTKMTRVSFNNNIPITDPIDITTSDSNSDGLFSSNPFDWSGLSSYGKAITTIVFIVILLASIFGIILFFVFMFKIIRKIPLNPIRMFSRGKKEIVKQIDQKTGKPKYFFKTPRANSTK